MITESVNTDWIKQVIRFVKIELEIQLPFNTYFKGLKLNFLVQDFILFLLSWLIELPVISFVK